MVIRAKPVDQTKGSFSRIYEISKPMAISEYRDGFLSLFR